MIFDFFNYLIFYIFQIKIAGEYQFLIFEFIRNYLLLIINGIFPLYISYSKNYKLPILTTKECAGNFSLLLVTEKTYDCFMKFLNTHSSDGSRLLLLWTDLNVFKHISNNPKKEVNLLSSEIYDNYIRENCENYVDIPCDIINKIEHSYKSSNKNTYNPCFDELLEYVFNTLKEVYYPNFKISDQYKDLEKDLETDEIIYSRLLASSMISSIELI